MLVRVLFILWVCVVLVYPTSDVGLNTVQLITKNGYPCETHYITTEDGYILSFHRIPYGRNLNKKLNRPAVLIMHGLCSSSTDFVNMGVNRSLGYILADQGYDVWLGNARGNFWSRNHTILDPSRDNKKFYDFSWHEIGYYDLPASIDYILKLKDDVNLYYAGVSQGGTAFYVLASTRPEYNKKIKLATLMAPAAALVHMQHPVYRILADNLIQLEALSRSLQIHEVPFVSTVRSFLQTFCSDYENIGICEAIYYFIGGNNLKDLDKSKLPIIFSSLPSNAAVKQFSHYAQLIRTDGFSYYDYGYRINKQLYGTTTPPMYNLTAITAPVAIYYGENDLISNYTDVETISRKLPNVIKMYLVPSYCHFDFMYAKNIRKVYVELLEDMARLYP